MKPGAESIYSRPRARLDAARVVGATFVRGSLDAGPRRSAHGSWPGAAAAAELTPKPKASHQRQLIGIFKVGRRLLQRRGHVGRVVGDGRAPGGARQLEARTLILLRGLRSRRRRLSWGVLQMYGFTYLYRNYTL